MKVKLIKGLSYSNGFITVTAKKPVVEVSPENGADLIASGYFQIVKRDEKTPDSSVQANKDRETDNVSVDVTVESSVPDISKMKVAELDELAIQLGIEFENGLSKSEKIEKISAFLEEHDV